MKRTPALQVACQNALARNVLHSSGTLRDVQGANCGFGWFVVVVRSQKRCGVCGQGVEMLRVLEMISVRRLKWLVAVVAFVAKGSGVGCYGEF